MIVLKTIYCYLNFSKESIRLFLSYHSVWTNIVNVILQISILNSFLFNIFIIYMLFFSTKYEIFQFADGSSLYSCGMNLDNIFTILIQDMVQSVI